MNRARYELQPGLWLDARRAAWLERTRALLVADLHLGYAWAHRQQGNLLPIATAEDTLGRLDLLASEYSPEEIIVLGDVVHGAVTEKAVTEDLRRLHALAGGVPVRLITGNHDIALDKMLRRAGLAVALHEEIIADGYLLLHGHGSDAKSAELRCREVAQRARRVILGHEHPATTLSDGVATTARCPCFLVGDDVLVLPAFSPWSAGTNARNGVFLSPYVRRAQLTQMVVIVANRLLPIPMRG